MVCGGSDGKEKKTTIACSAEAIRVDWVSRDEVSPCGRGTEGKKGCGEGVGGKM